MDHGIPPPIIPTNAARRRRILIAGAIGWILIVGSSASILRNAYLLGPQIGASELGYLSILVVPAYCLHLVVARWRGRMRLNALVVGLVGVFGATFFGVLSQELVHSTNYYTSYQNSQNVKEQARWLLVYGLDHDDRLPPAKWMDRLAPYGVDQRTFVDPCLEHRRPDEFGYAMNANLAGVRLGEVVGSDRTLLTFESTNHVWNAAESVASLPNPPLSPYGDSASVASGEDLKFVRLSMLKDFIVKPKLSIEAKK